MRVGFDAMNPIQTNANSSVGRGQILYGGERPLTVACLLLRMPDSGSSTWCVGILEVQRPPAHAAASTRFFAGGIRNLSNPAAAALLQRDDDDDDDATYYVRGSTAYRMH